MTTMRNRAVVSHADAMSDEIPDPEVPERAKRPRSYSARYKAEILAEYETLDREGKGALLRREGLYTSLLSEWRKQRDRGALQALGTPSGSRRSTRWSGRPPGCVVGSSSWRVSWARPAR
jgi:transposase